MDVYPHDYSKVILVEDTLEPSLEDNTTRLEDEAPLQALCEEPQTSLHALLGFSTPQTLKLIGYIKHYKVIVLIDSDNTHNFIHRRVTQDIHRYVCSISNFQFMITNGGMMKYGCPYENVKLQIVEYHLTTHMFSIEMGGCDIVLEVEWLCTLGPVTMNFKELYMSFM